MRDETQTTAPQPIHLKDYSQPHHWVEDVHLTFELSPSATRVKSKITFRANAANPGPLVLDGENLKLISARVDGETVSPKVTETGLTLEVPQDQFLWQAEVEISPEDNTALEGLYMSKGMFCTQCEAEGFRKITYYPDRPDIMAPFTVWINGKPPVLLSNGNLTASGPGFAEWHDPWPKPAYLFALVAGDLISHEDQFMTRSGREVTLKIWVRRGDEDKCAHAMDALKRSMRWDETEYGREYDLDLFQIVAVDDFNMGAMENKGLNIFNSKYVLASPETATDRDYALIEGIIAHEYFHNWTGNRITCRDWFQLCLKEGLTVFRDQQFSGDERSHAVQRIEDVLQLRARQFREDAGPLAHPVRPAHYVEINNFYTATVYEKGSEVIGMLRTLIGPKAYRKGCDLYFDRHDGQACTIEDWLKVFEDVTGRDLSQFKRWYTQPGTPRVTVEDDFSNGTYTLSFKQENAKAPMGSPHVIPIATGLLASDGSEITPTQILELAEANQSFSFEGLSERPTASLFRWFSAPVILDHKTSAETKAFLLANDTDPFNKFEAGRALTKDTLSSMIVKGTPPSATFFDALKTMLSNEASDPAFRAIALGLPSEDDLAQTLFDSGHVPDPTTIHDVREQLAQTLAEALEPELAKLYDTNATPGTYSPDATSAGKRALRTSALGLLTKLDGGARAKALFASADNMTESLAALSALLGIDAASEELRSFYDRWSGDQLVMDKWFMMQILRAKPSQVVVVTSTLTEHPDFDWKNPNRFRSVLGALIQSPAGFHDASGAGYALLADWLLKLDPLNPQTAARMSSAFETWRRYDADRQHLMTSQLDRILATKPLSRDLTEMATRMRGS